MFNVVSSVARYMHDISPPLRSTSLINHLFEPDLNEERMSVGFIVFYITGRSRVFQGSTPCEAVKSLQFNTRFA
jgi:hypothetical protein